MSTKIVAKCISKKESQSWDKDNPIATTIELEVPYDTTSIYGKMTGGTKLNTINKQAADMFELGKYYDILISPSEN